MKTGNAKEDTNPKIRGMGLAATRAAAARHDALIEQAYHRIVADGGATPGERSRAVRQARLAVPMGGLGLTSQSGMSRAACVGSWALIWRPMQQLCPQLFAHVDIATSTLRALKELQQAHRELREVHARVAGVYDLWDSTYYDYDKDVWRAARASTRPTFRPRGCSSLYPRWLLTPT